jgi:hypothetical protein
MNAISALEEMTGLKMLAYIGYSCPFQHDKTYIGGLGKGPVNFEVDSRNTHQLY